MNDSWKNDPRLKSMPPEKLSFLMELAKETTQSDKQQLVPAFLSLSTHARQKGICFSEEESDLLLSVIASGMTSEEQKKLENLKNMIRQINLRK